MAHAAELVQVVCRRLVTEVGCPFDRAGCVGCEPPCLGEELVQGPAAALPGRLEEGPAIASVTLGFPADGRRGGHLVVLRGYELDAADPLILFRDPSGWGQQHDRILLSTLAHSYAGRCITFKADTPPARTDTP